MVKILKLAIGTCSECPFLKFNYEDNEWICGKVDEYVFDIDDIPPYCPLPDKEE